MPASGAAEQAPYLRPRLAPIDSLVSEVTERLPVIPVGGVRALAWAVLASTVHRVRRGEGVLLAVNLSLIAIERTTVARALVQVCVSTLAILVMYAFNDLYDAPVDSRNPKKDPRLIATWLAHRKIGVVVAVVLKVVTLAVAMVCLGTSAAAPALAVMIVNVVYSTVLKGVPVADIVAVGVWGTLYAAIVGGPPALLVVVGLMTAICHLFQVLDDRDPDAANGIVTTAVRSRRLSRDVLIALALLLAAIVLPYLGVLGAVTTVVPLLIFFAVDDAGIGWLLTKAYFAGMWLSLLWSAGAMA